MLKISSEKNKKGLVIIPKVNYTIKYNINNAPNINTKKTDYDSIRDIVEGNDDKAIKKTNENIINKSINKFQIV